MDTRQIVGSVLVAAGALDIVVARFVLERRIADPRQRAVAVGVATSGGALMMLLGGAFLAGWMPAGG